MTLEEMMTVAAAIESIATAAGIVVAGVWTYRVFVRRRQSFPRATVSHQPYHFRLPDGRTLVRVTAKIANSGEVLVCLRNVITRVQQLLPLPEHIEAELLKSPHPANEASEFPWPVLGKRQWHIDETLGEVEPGETETLQSDFIIPAGVDSVLIYTYVSNQAKSDTIGWSDTIMLSLHEGKTMAHPQPPQDPKWEEKQLPYRPDPDPPPMTPQLPYRPDPPAPPPPKNE